jgi:2'-5' RNA ligase
MKRLGERLAPERPVHLSNPDIGPEGVRVAIYPPDFLAREIALPGAERPEDLHVALAFVGTLDDRPEASPATGWPELENAVAETAAANGPFTVVLRGTGTFPSDDPDQRAMAALARAPQLFEVRRDLLAALKAHGIVLSEPDGRWVPHMTLDYLASGEEPVPVDTNWGKFHADAITVTIGPRATIFLLGEAA